MASGGCQYSEDAYKRRKRLHHCFRIGSRRGDEARAQNEWKWCRLNRYRMQNTIKVLLLLLGVFTAPTVVSARVPSIDYGSLTWSKWSEIYTLADVTALRKIYRSGPRVRAKVMVSTQIALSELEAGEAIFRERIRDIVQVENIERVQFEYLQTDVAWEDERGTYYVALGISALPPPYASTGSSLVLPSIESERERIVEKVRYGSILASENVTINSLSLFGEQVRLVDITLDGEAFVQIYLKPWIGMQLVIASAISVATGVSNSDHYTTDRSAFQDLRLRFLLAHQLRSVQVGVSDVILHSPVDLLPFDVFHANAGVLELEIHVHDNQYADVVETILLGGSSSTSSTTPSKNLAEAFNEMNPQWKLLAVDVDTAAGELFTPAIEPSAFVATPDNRDSGFVTELKFEMNNVSMAQLERTKWSVLDFIRIEAAHITSGRVRFGRISFPASSSELSSLDPHNDASGVAADSIFDPINAMSWTLSFQVESEDSRSADLANHILDTQTYVEMVFEQALGRTTGSSGSTTLFKGAVDWIDPVNSASSLEPFVSFTLTIQLEPLGASGIILESPNFFQLHYVRCALVLLLQQVAILDDQVTLISAKAVDLPSIKVDKTGHAWHRLLFFEYRVTIFDESQRRGIRSVIFSHRLATTILLYSGSTLELVERKIKLHADGSPGWPQYFPGVSIAVPAANNTSDGFTTSTESQLGHQESFTYDFSNPESNPSSGILVGGTGLCPAATNSSELCIKLHFTGSFQVAPIFLRTLHSLRPIQSPSINLPPMHAALDAADSSGHYPAPWVLVGEQSANEETAWALLVGASTDTKTYSIRLTFAAADTMQDLSATTPFTLDLEFNSDDIAASPVVRRRQFGDLAVVSTLGQPAPAFITAEAPELLSDGTQITSVHITLDLQKPRLGGLYSVSLLNGVAPLCTDCTAAMTDCNSILECRAFSACASVLLDADLTLISTMLQSITASSVDASWLLKDCLNPSDGTVWSSSIREKLVSSWTCLWENHCPLAYSAAVNRQLVLDYQHGQQTLTFELVSGFASLSFVLNAGEEELAQTTYEFVEDFSSEPVEVTTQLDAMLTEMYRTALSNVATVESTLTTSEDATSGAVTAHLTIEYHFLGKFPLPFVQITNSGNTATSGIILQEESLHLRAIPIDP